MGLRSPATAVSVALSLATLALCVRGVRQTAQPLWEYRRKARRNLVFAHFLLSSACEALVIPNQALVATIIALKLAGIAWYIRFGRHDAGAPSGLTVPGVWGDHDTFHATATAAALLQCFAAWRYLA